MTRPGIVPRSPGPLANTLPTWPIRQGFYTLPILNLKLKEIQNCSLDICRSNIIYIYIESKSYCRMKWNLGGQTLNEAVCILRRAWERYASNYSHFCYGKTVGRTWLFSLGMTTSLEEKESNFKLVKVCLKINLVSHFARTEGWYIYIYTYAQKFSMEEKSVRLYIYIYIHCLSIETFSCCMYSIFTLFLYIFFIHQFEQIIGGP